MTARVTAEWARDHSGDVVLCFNGNRDKQVAIQADRLQELLDNLPAIVTSQFRFACPKLGTRLHRGLVEIRWGGDWHSSWAGRRVLFMTTPWWSMDAEIVEK